MMADELERAIWAKHVLSLYTYRDFGIFRTDSSYDFVGVHPYKRLAELGVTKLTHAAKTLPESDEYMVGKKSIEALAKWAKGFELTPFVAMRKLQEAADISKKYFPRPPLKFSGNRRGP